MTRLKRELEDRGILQRDFAEQIGVTEVSMSRYCTGTRVPRFSIAVKISDALNMDIKVLFAEAIR